MARNKKLMGLAGVASACGLALAISSAPANATAYLRVCDITTGTCNNQSGADASPLSYVGPLGDWNLTVAVGSSPGSQSLPQLDLTFGAQSIGRAMQDQQLEIVYYIDDAIGAGNLTFLTTVGGTDSPGASGTYLSATQQGTFNPLSQFSSSSASFNFSGLATQDLVGSYDLGMIVDLFDLKGTVGGVTGDMNIRVPEPGTIALFGAALLGCALFLRRRRLPNV